MTRFITYPNQLAGSLTQMQMQVESMIEQGLIMQAILGNGQGGSDTDTLPLFIGFETTPSDPASLIVNVGAGTIFSWEVVDATNFGQSPSQIPADTENSITKMAYTFDSTPLTFIPPGTMGFSRNDLIEIGFLEEDGNDQNIPFYNGFTTGGGFGIPIYQDLPTQRIDSPVIQVKLGIAAATGTQVTPTPDVGFAGAFVVTTANGQTTITSGNIVPYDGGSLISETLTQKISQSSADGRYAQPSQIQNNQFTQVTDIGALNALVVAPTPAFTAYAPGQSLIVSPANTNTGASTINVSGLGVHAIVRPDGSSLSSGDLVAGSEHTLILDSSNFWILQNPATNLSAVTAAATYETISNAIATYLNFSGFTLNSNANGYYFEIPMNNSGQKFIIQFASTEVNPNSPLGTLFDLPFVYPTAQLWALGNFTVGGGTGGAATQASTSQIRLQNNDSIVQNINWISFGH